MPLIHVSNRASSDQIPIWIMAVQPAWAIGQGHAVCDALVPGEQLHNDLFALIADRQAAKPLDATRLERYKTGYKRQLLNYGRAGLLSPGALLSRWGRDETVIPTNGRAVLLCQCAREFARRGECHRCWATDALRYFGWEVSTDFEEAA